MNSANQPEPSLREQMRVLHNRFHGRFETHAEVAKHSRWTREELENVQIEDEEIYYSELAALFQADKEAAVREARLEGLDIALKEVACVTEGKPNRVSKCMSVISEERTRLAGEGEGK